MFGHRSECLSAVWEGDVVYLAANFTYCASSDATCSSCREEWLKESSTESWGPTEKCVGADGCICLAACEAPGRDVRIVHDLCPSFGDSSSISMGMVVGVTVGIVVVSLLFLYGANLFIKRRAVSLIKQQQLAQELQEIRRPVASVDIAQLNLTGWTSMRENLEHSRLKEGANPTLSSTTTPAVINEEDGEGYRPLSSSDRHSPRRDL
ncbi:hypothetical protein BBJ28_00023822 [Nothophytophthora sp. Chile5]|nr:hypothetical protein BBJ28_00023822 [Nothophytophthora sp. Chile5]